MRSWNLSRSCLLLLLLFVLPAQRAVHAQGIITGAMTGTVVDPRGAVIPGASITAVETRTGAKLTTTSLGNGEYAFRDAPIGVYALTITAAGFRPFLLRGVRVVTGVVTALGEQTLTLPLGTSSTVKVQDHNSVQLDTTESQVTTTFSTQQLEDLPLANKFDSVALLIPGVAQTFKDGMSNANGANFSVNGQRGRSNNFELDGQSDNDNSIAGPQIYFGNQDALAEIQVITDNFSAEYGRNMGSVVNYITKSGTNTFHGSGFELYAGSWLSSLENQQKSPLFGFCLPNQKPDETGLQCADSCPAWTITALGERWAGRC